MWGAVRVLEGSANGTGRLVAWVGLLMVLQQVMIIFAVSNGFIDDVPVAKVREWEAGFHDYMKAQFPQVGDTIRTEKAISKETEADLRRGIDEYKKLSK